MDGDFSNGSLISYDFSFPIRTTFPVLGRRHITIHRPHFSRFLVLCTVVLVYLGVHRVVNAVFLGFLGFFGSSSLFLLCVLCTNQLQLNYLTCGKQAN